MWRHSGNEVELNQMSETWSLHLAHLGSGGEMWRACELLVAGQLASAVEGRPLGRVAREHVPCRSGA